MDLTENKNNSLIIKKELHQLRIEKKWSKGAGIVMVLFSIIWTSIASFIGAGFVGNIITDLFSGQFQVVQLIALFFG